MRKAIISLFLVFCLLFNSCASIRVNGVEIGNKDEVQNEIQVDGVKTEDILGWTILITVCGIMYIVVPICVATNIKIY